MDRYTYIDPCSFTTDADVYKTISNGNVNIIVLVYTNE